MKKLIATFSYAGNFYELFVSDNGLTSVSVIGSNKYKVNNDEVCKKVIDRINKLRNDYFYSIEYLGETLDVYYDRIVDLFYFKKDGKKINEENTKYLDLYKMYNYLPQYYNYDYNDEYNDGYSSYNDYYDRSSNFSSYSDDEYYEYDFDYKKSIKNKNKKIKITIGSIVLSVSLIVGSFVVVPNIIKAKDSKEELPIVQEEITEIDNTPVIIYSESSNLSIEEQIRKSITDLCGEQPEWLYQYAIENYYRSIDEEAIWEALENGASQEEVEKIEESFAEKYRVEPEKIDFNLASERTNKMIDAIKSNTNISEEDKNIIIDGLFNTFQHDSKYYDEHSFEWVLVRLSCFKIDKTYLETNEPKKEDDGLLLAGTCSPSGNITIYVKSKYNSTLCHEVQHVLGQMYEKTYAYNKINEGMTETYCGLNSSYSMERNFYIILEQIYGEDFFKDAFYNRKSLYNVLMDRFGDNQFKEHYDLLVEINKFCIDYQSDSVSQLYENEDYQSRVNKLFDELMTKYNEVTGLNYQDNVVLTTCYSYFTDINNTLPNNIHVGDVKKDLDGNYYTKYSGDYSYNIDGKFQKVIFDHDELIR